MLKKLVYSLGILTAFTLPAAAQKAKVVSAFNYLKFDEYDKAKAAIDEASKEPSSAKMYKTWYYRGMIYQAIHEKHLDSTMAPGALDTAMAAYKKSLQIAPENEFTSETTQGAANLGVEYYKIAYKFYSAENYSASFENFAKMLACDDVIRMVNKTYRKDTMIIFNAALTATRAKRFEESKPYYDQLIDLKYKDAYVGYSQVYKELKDTTKALAIIEKGLVDYPNEKDFITTRTNIYIAQKNLDKAISSIKDAITADPKNAQLLVILGSAYENLTRSEDARKAFDDALKLDPENYDANEMMGTSYFNEGAKFHNKTKEYTDMSKQKEYDALVAQRNASFLKALPYLEKANKAKPGQEDVEKMIKKIKGYTGQ